VIIKTAEKNGVPWRKSYRILENSAAKSLLPTLVNPDVTYPDYYQVPFHAYEQGNLCWQAALEAPAATYAMGLRVWKQETLTWEAAHQRLRGSFHQALSSYLPDRIETVLDMGCSVGISTLSLHRYLQKRQSEPIQTTGLDLSPYMLAVAKVLDEQQEIAQWSHGNGEKTDFADNTFDLITIQFLFHELPHQPTRQILQEAQRILRPGGILAIVDNDPASPVIQALPPALFLLMKSTEPWSDAYYTLNLEEAIRQTGLEYQTTIASDPRHRSVIATKAV
jgi:ubiquinone/menaquinone biosynthesis C-methylase UbiE